MSDGVFWPEFEAWMLAHGIDPQETAQLRWVPPHAGAGDRPQTIEVTAYKTRDGRRYLEDGEPATHTRLVPMRHLPAVEVVRYRTESPDADA
jgi:hypothetical protein